MTQANSNETFRQAAEEEGGLSVSAGGRVVHARSAVNSGRAFYVDLAGVPEDDRPAIISAIKELVSRAGSRPQEKSHSHP